MRFECSGGATPSSWTFITIPTENLDTMDHHRVWIFPHTLENKIGAQKTSRKIKRHEIPILSLSDMLGKKV